MSNIRFGDMTIIRLRGAFVDVISLELAGKAGRGLSCVCAGRPLSTAARPMPSFAFISSCLLPGPIIITMPHLVFDSLVTLQRLQARDRNFSSATGQSALANRLLIEFWGFVQQIDGTGRIGLALFPRVARSWLCASRTVYIEKPLQCPPQAHSCMPELS